MSSRDSASIHLVVKNVDVSESSIEAVKDVGRTKSFEYVFLSFSLFSKNSLETLLSRGAHRHAITLCPTAGELLECSVIFFFLTPPTKLYCDRVVTVSNYRSSNVL